MMHDPEKSDSSIVATKPANNPGAPGAEPVERRGEAEGNTINPPTCRTQGRGSVSPGLERVRHASPSVTQGGSRMPELGTFGSVRGALSNERPYRDPHLGVESPAASR